MKRLFLFDIRNEYASGDPEDALNLSGVLKADNSEDAQRLIAAYVLELGIECEVGEEVKFHLSEVKEAPHLQSTILPTTYPEDCWCPGVEIGGDEEPEEEDEDSKEIHEP